MPQTSQQKISFNSGVMSPTLAARLDLEKAAAGCRILDNFIPRDSGAAFKRAGFEFLGRTKDSGSACLRHFNYSVNTRFQLEFGGGYVRFWRDRARVHLPVGANSAWSGTTTQYEIGTPVFEANLLYRATGTHTPSGGNQPPSASWTTTNVKKWVASTGYVVGDIVSESLVMYVCKTAHTSGSSFSATNWGKVSTTAFWGTGNSYALGDKVFYTVSGNYRAFRCIVAHTSGSSTEPGIGGSWTSRWENISTPPNHSTASKAYVAGDAVKVGSTVYLCNANHTSSSSNEPLDVGSPWSAMTGIIAWSGTSTARVIGDWVFYGNSIVRFNVNVTTGTYISFVQFTNGNVTFIIRSIGATIDTWTSSPTYALNAIVSHGTPSALYVSIADHVTSSTTEPGTDGGAPYWQKLNNIFRWVTGTNYSAGEYVVNDGVSYLVLTNHTSGTFATDLSNLQLEEAPYPLELRTPYSLAEAFEVNPVAINDQVWLMHPNHETLLLERFADTAWKIGPIEWDWPPMRDENVESGHTLTASGTTGNITLSSSLKFFDPRMVGAYVQIAHRRDQSTEKLSFAASGTGTALRVNGRLDIFIYGTAWKGTVHLEFSDDGSTNWQVERSWVQPVANMRTISTNVTTPKEVYARLRFVRDGTGTATDYAIIEAANARVTGLVKITGYQSPTVVNAKVLKQVWSTDPTTLWSEGAYSNMRGWPRAATVHEQRLVLIGTEDESEKVRASRFDGFFDFTELTSDDGALAFVAASRESNALMWVESFGKVLAAGSLAEEWSIGSGGEGKVLTPTNPPRIERETRVGSCNIPALLLGDALVFIANDRQQVMEFSYSFSEDKYVKQEMTQLAQHLLSSGIKQIASSRQPDTVLYCVMNDGRLLSFTYDRGQGVVAWAQHTTDGLFESVSVIYGGELNADEVWVVVKRNFGTYEARYVEALHKETARYRFEGPPNELCYCDSSVLIVNDPPSTEVHGLGHLEGKVVTVLADGVVRDAAVDAGMITLATPASVVRVGLPFTAKLQGNWLDMQLEDGSAQDKKQRVAKATVITHQSNGMEYHADPDEGTGQWYGGELGNISSIAARVTRPTKFEVTNVARHHWETNLTLRSSRPLPVNILAIIYRNEYFG